jgi:hypothetical protein
VDMVCSICHRPGIYWVGLAGLSPYTKCPHCGGSNCQVPEEEQEEEEEGNDAEPTE